MPQPSKASNADTTAKHPLQAVVLADSFTRTFRPMSLERPKVLMPIANSPMIEYTLEMLANAKVKEIIVVCCWHAAQVAEYLKQSRWGLSKNPSVKVVSFPKADSAGTALRELAGMGIMQSDPFILISGDVVSNVRLGPVLRAHIEREDKNQIMTMVFRKTNPGNPLRNFDDDLVVAMNADTKQLLMYEMDEGEPDEDNDGEYSLKLGKDARFFVDNTRLEIRHDLLDCHIDICSPEVFSVLQDEFYEDLRLGMVRKEVSNPEFSHNFYVHELTMPQDYAARVHCIRSYDQVSKDVIGRWLYPLTPDNNWSTKDGSCWFTRGFMYREQGVVVDRTATIGRCTMIGEGTAVAEHAVIENSVLGRKVVVENKANVQGSYVLDGAVIGAGASIDRALICNDAVIGAGAKIMRGAIVSFGVNVPPNTVILPFTRLTKADPYVDEGASWDDGSEDAGAGTGGVILNSSSATTTAGNIAMGMASPSFQVGQEAVDDKSYREYTLEEEDFDAPPLPEWASRALDEATGIWKASKSLVLGSMGCDELEDAKQNRSCFAELNDSKIRSDVDEAVLGAGGPGGVPTSNQSFNPTMDGNLSAEVVHLLSGLFSTDLASRTDGFFDDLSMELKGLRASQVLCSFSDIVSVTFAVMLQTVLADFKQVPFAQLKERLSTFISGASRLLLNFTKRILNQETAIQVALIQSAELCCLIGPSLAPDVLLELPRVEYRVEAALGVDDISGILNEHASLRDCFALIILLLVSNDIIELPSLQQWKAERTKLVEADGDSSHFLDMYRYAERRVDAIIAALEAKQGESEEETDDDEEEDDE